MGGGRGGGRRGGKGEGDPSGLPEIQERPSCRQGGGAECWTAPPPTLEGSAGMWAHPVPLRRAAHGVQGWRPRRSEGRGGCERWACLADGAPLPPTHRRRFTSTFTPCRRRRAPAPACPAAPPSAGWGATWRRARGWGPQQPACGLTRKTVWAAPWVGCGTAAEICPGLCSRQRAG
jgi:hypothetical protein